LEKEDRGMLHIEGGGGERERGRRRENERKRSNRKRRKRKDGKDLLRQMSRGYEIDRLFE
jgi:hypothetical protein